MRPRVKPEAEDELLIAAFWYEDERPGLGEEFFDHVLATIESIGRNPLRFPLCEIEENPRQFRRAMVARFPYIVVYEIMAESVVVVAIAHTSRQIGYWRHR